MRAYAIDTLRQAIRSPGPWLLLLLGTLAGWFGLGLAILALGEAGRQVTHLVGGTCHAFSALTVLWILAGRLEDDRTSGFARAADCTRAGAGSRLLGRWAGALAAGGAVGVLLLVALAALGREPVERPVHLYIASLQGAALMGAWALLFGSAWGGPVVLLAGGLAWVLGHLPWGSADLAPGPVGRALGSLLPGPAPFPEASLSRGAAALAVLLVALFLAPRDD